MTYSELTRKLRNLGCEFRRQAKEDHEIWGHCDRKLYTSIPHITATRRSPLQPHERAQAHQVFRFVWYVNENSRLNENLSRCLLLEPPFLMISHNLELDSNPKLC